jgi:hypothetical protein
MNMDATMRGELHTLLMDLVDAVSWDLDYYQERVAAIERWVDERMRAQTGGTV